MNVVIDIKALLSLAADKGWSAKECHDPDYVAFDCGPAPDTNERMRLTAEGALLTVDDGRYWQVVSLKDAYEGLSKI